MIEEYLKEIQIKLFPNLIAELQYRRQIKQLLGKKMKQILKV